MSELIVKILFLFDEKKNFECLRNTIILYVSPIDSRSVPIYDIDVLSYRIKVGTALTTCREHTHGYNIMLCAYMCVRAYV